MDMINRAFLETMLDGDANGRGFQYPIPTYSITKEFELARNDNQRLLFELAGKYKKIKCRLRITQHGGNTKTAVGK